MKEEYKILKLTSEELNTLKRVLMTQIVETKIKQNDVEEEELTSLEKFNLELELSKYQNVLRIISYVERD